MGSLLVHALTGYRGNYHANIFLLCLSFLISGDGTTPHFLAGTNKTNSTSSTALQSLIKSMQYVHMYSCPLFIQNHHIHYRKTKHLHGRYGECDNCLSPDCSKCLDKKNLVVLGGKRKLVSTENASELRMSTMSSNQQYR